MRNPQKNKTSFFIRGFTQSAFLTVISRISGFIRDILLAAAFGAGPVSDAFFVAFKLPNMFRRLVAEGALVQSFIPTLSYVDKTFSKISSQEITSSLLYTSPSPRDS